MQVNQIPSTGFLTQRQILGDKKRNIPGIIPVGPTTWWAGIKSGRYPQGVKISARRTAWPVESIQALVNSLNKSD
ncbi:MAG: AlpA family transcriptional regulator [Methylococcaceae bacterium]|nr:AlpA family transcriptional regulator [Methylococcaceae bacterium]